MAKVKSIITEGDVTFMADPTIEFVSLVSHAANRQPFKVIKGEVKGENEMAKQAIYSVLVSKDVTEEKLQEITEAHGISTEQKVEDELEGYDVYKQVADEEVDLETRKMAKLEDGAYVIVADLKEYSEKDGIEKEEMDWQTMDKVADALFSMVDVVLGTIRQPEADGASRKAMIQSAITNFNTYANSVLDTVKAEDVLEELEINSEVIKEYFEKNEEGDEPVDVNALIEAAKEELKADFEAKIKEVSDGFEKTKEDLNTSLNQHLDEYQKKEDADKAVAEVKEELESLKNTTKSRKSEIDEGTPVATKTEPKTKKHQFITFV